MPNHIHGIIEIKPISDVGADLRVCPQKYTGEHTGSPLQIQNMEKYITAECVGIKWKTGNTRNEKTYD